MYPSTVKKFVNITLIIGMNLLGP